MNLKELVDRNYRRTTDGNVAQELKKHIESTDFNHYPLPVIEGTIRIAARVIEQKPTAFTGLETRLLAIAETAVARRDCQPKIAEFIHNNSRTIAHHIFTHTGDSTFGERAYKHATEAAKFDREQPQRNLLRAANIAEQLHHATKTRTWLERAFASRYEAEKFIPPQTEAALLNIQSLLFAARSLYQATNETIWARRSIDIGFRTADMQRPISLERAGVTYADTARLAQELYKRFKDHTWAKSWYDASLAGAQINHDHIPQRAAFGYVRAGQAANILYLATKDTKWLEAGLDAHEKSIALSEEAKNYAALHGAVEMSSTLFRLTGKDEYKRKAEQYQQYISESDSAFESSDDLDSAPTDDLEQILVENYRGLTTPDCKERVIEFLTIARSVDTRSIKFIKRLAKVVRHIELEEPESLDKVIGKAYNFIVSGIARVQQHTGSIEATVITSHLHAYAADAAHRIFRNTNDNSWAKHWHDHYLASARLAETKEARHASHAYGFAAKAARELFERTQDLAFARDAIFAGQKEIELSLSHAPHRATAAVIYHRELALAAAATGCDETIVRELYTSSITLAKKHISHAATEAFLHSARAAAYALSDISKKSAPLEQYYQDEKSFAEQLKQHEPASAAHRFSNAADAARDLLEMTRDAAWAERWYFDMRSAAELEPMQRTAAHQLGFAAKAAKKAYRHTNDLEWIKRAYESDLKSAELSKTENPSHAAYSHLYAGESAETLFAETGEHAWAIEWYDRLKTAGAFLEREKTPQARNSLDRRLRAAEAVFLATQDHVYLLEIARINRDLGEHAAEPASRAKHLFEASTLTLRVASDEQDEKTALESHGLANLAADIYRGLGQQELAAKALAIAGGAAHHLYKRGHAEFGPKAATAYEGFLSVYATATDGAMAKAVERVRRILPTLKND